MKLKNNTNTKFPSLGGVGENSEKAFKILVIQQKMIGDVLVSSLICENLKKNYPNAIIHYVLNRFTLPVIENNPFIDEIIVFEEKYKQSKYQFLKFLLRIKSSKYNLVIDAYGKIESNLITLFSGAETKISWKKNYTKLIYTHVVEKLKQPQTTAGLAIEDRLNLLSPLQLPNILQNKPKIYLTEIEKQKAKAKLTNWKINFNQPLFMIALLGSDESKTYPLAKMAKVLDFLVEKTNAQLLFNYIPKQREKAIQGYRLCKKSTQKNICFDLTADTLREFMALTHYCDALIGNEGGAVNMAKALQVPTFTIFSPWINPIAWASFEEGEKNRSIHLKDVKGELYSNNSFKELKAQYESFYNQLDEVEVTKALNKFLTLMK